MKLKLSEMIAKLEENPKRIGMIGKDYRVSVDSEGNIVSELDDSLAYLNMNINDKCKIIEPEPESVDFQTALNALVVKSKTIKCVYKNTSYVYEPFRMCGMLLLHDRNFRAISAEEILEGKWYID